MLTIVSSLKDSSVSIGTVLFKIVLYIVFMALLALLINKNRRFIDKNVKKQRISTYVLAACLLVSFASEHFFGVADITGAYLLGLFLSTHAIKKKLQERSMSRHIYFFRPYSLPASGLKVELEGMTGTIIVFSFILLAVAILTKIIGCGLGAKNMWIYSERGPAGGSWNGIERRGSSYRGSERI